MGRFWCVKPCLSDPIADERFRRANRPCPTFVPPKRGGLRRPARDSPPSSADSAPFRPSPSRFTPMGERSLASKGRPLSFGGAVGLVAYESRFVSPAMMIKSYGFTTLVFRY
jgi:hypothetical protein